MTKGRNLTILLNRVNGDMLKRDGVSLWQDLHYFFAVLLQGAAFSRREELQEAGWGPRFPKGEDSRRELS